MPKFIIILYLIFCTAILSYAQETVTRDSTYIRNDTVFVVKIVTIKEKVYIKEPLENLEDTTPVKIENINTNWSTYFDLLTSYTFDKISKCPLKCDFVEAYENSISNQINSGFTIGALYNYNRFVANIEAQLINYKTKFEADNIQSNNSHLVFGINLRVGYVFNLIKDRIEIIPLIGMQTSTTVSENGSLLIKENNGLKLQNIPKDFYKSLYLSNSFDILFLYKLNSKFKIRIVPFYSVDISSVTSNNFFINWRNSIGIKTGIQYNL